MADVSSDIKDWSTTASSNSPADATTVGAGLADNLQQIQATVRAAFAHKGADIASATTTDLGAVVGAYHDITGTTTITGFGTVSAGVRKVLQFDGALTLTYNATSMILPGNADITTAAGDHLEAMSLGSGNWIVLWYTKDAAGAAPPFSDAVGLVRDASDPTKVLRIDVGALTTATTRVLTVQDEDGTIALTSEFAYSNVAGSSGRQALPRMWISGLTYSRDTDTDHDTAIAAGEARDDTNAVNMILSSVLTKRIDAAWAVGDDQGGLDGSESVGGTPDANTWYYIWLIKRSDTGVVDALYSESATSPTMPANYDYKRLIGKVRTDGSANIINYSVLETAGGGLYFRFASEILDVDSTSQSTTQVSNALTLPATTVIAHLIVSAFDGTQNSARIYPTDATNVDIAGLNPGDAGVVGNVGGRQSSGSAIGVAAEVRVKSISATVNSRASGALDRFKIVTLGFDWGRR